MLHFDTGKSTSSSCRRRLIDSVNQKLEYLAVYGRASMAAFRQLSTYGQKFDPESLYEPM